jgi:hypothetical protein
MLIQAPSGSGKTALAVKLAADFLMQNMLTQAAPENLLLVVHSSSLLSHVAVKLEAELQARVDSDLKTSCSLCARACDDGMFKLSVRGEDRSDVSAVYCTTIDMLVLHVMRCVDGAQAPGEEASPSQDSEWEEFVGEDTFFGAGTQLPSCFPYLVGLTCIRHADIECLPCGGDKGEKSLREVKKRCIAKGGGCVVVNSRKHLAWIKWPSSKDCRQGKMPIRDMEGYADAVRRLRSHDHVSLWIPCEKRTWSKERVLGACELYDGPLRAGSIIVDEGHVVFGEQQYGWLDGQHFLPAGEVQLVIDAVLGQSTRLVIFHDSVRILHRQLHALD